MRPGVNGTVDVAPASLAAFSIAATPPSTIRSASETFLPPVCAALNAFWIVFELAEHLGELRRLVDLPVLLRREADARAVGAAALVGAAEGRGRGPGRRDQFGDRQAGGEDLRLQVRRCPCRRSARGRPPASGPARSAPPPAPAGRGSATCGPMSRWVSLNQARAKASAKAPEFLWKRREIFS